MEGKCLPQCLFVLQRDTTSLLVVGYCVWVIDSGLLCLVCSLLVRSWFAVASWRLIALKGGDSLSPPPCRIDECGMTSQLISYTILPYYRIEPPSSQRKGNWPSPCYAWRESHHPSPFLELGYWFGSSLADKE